MKDTAPCPWCKEGGKSFLYLSRKPFMSYTVQCNTCFARGPHVTFDPNIRSRKSMEEISKPARVEAIKLWNELCNRIGDKPDEKPEKNS